MNTEKRKSNERLYVLFLKDRLKLLEDVSYKIKKVEEFEAISGELNAYQDCLNVFTSLFDVNIKGIK